MEKNQGNHVKVSCEECLPGHNVTLNSNQNYNTNVLGECVNRKTLMYEVLDARRCEQAHLS